MASGTILNYLYLKPTVRSNAAVSGQSLTVSSTSVSLAATTQFDKDTNAVVLDIQSNNVYCTFDGQTPSSSVGHILYAGQNYTWSKAAAITAKFIRVTNDATIWASEFTV